jgi:diguanylate cyclase (GGDEF)-like protein/PAS domain S-box-containing protein
MNSNPSDRHLEAERFSEVLLTIVDHLDAMVAYWDVNQVCLFANTAYQEWFGKTREEMVGLTLKELLGPLYPKNLPYIVAALAGQRQVFEREIPTPDGRIRYSLATYTPHIVNSQVRGMIAHVADVAPLKKLEQELQTAKAKAEQLATHDFLTGLPNRVLLLDRIVQALALAKRKHQMVAVFSLDIDDFKKVNDTYGHGEGDRLLVEFATRAKNILRESDTLTRLGGDEFLLLAPEIESDVQVETMANRILERMRQPFQLGEATILPTLSMGIALYPRHGATPETLITNSDRALYGAKKLGKNRYAFANQGETQEPTA